MHAITLLLVAALFPASSDLATTLQISATSTLVLAGVQRALVARADEVEAFLPADSRSLSPNRHTVSRPEMVLAKARFADTPAAQAGLQPVAPPDPLGALRPTPLFSTPTERRLSGLFCRRS